MHLAMRHRCCGDESGWELSEGGWEIRKGGNNETYGPLEPD
jgi:hypothetical protein